MRILLIGELFSDNLGDQLIYDITRRIIEEQYPDSEIRLLDIMGRNRTRESGNDFSIHEKKQIKKSSLFARLSRFAILDYIIKKHSANNLKEYYKAIINQDISFAVFTGGALIQDSFALYILEIIKLLEQNNIPVVFNGVDVGTQSFINQVILKHIINNPIVKGISCRCIPDRFECLSPNKKIISTFDCAVLTSDYYIKHKENRVTVGLGIMNSSRFSHSQLIHFWINAINMLNSRGITWKIFTTGSLNDKALALEIIDLAGIKKTNEVAVFPTTVMELVNVIQSFNSILSFRLHSHIVAFSYGIPSVGIFWDNKIQDFFDKAQISNRVYSIHDDIQKIINTLLFAIIDHEIVYSKKKITRSKLSDLLQTI